MGYEFTTNNRSTAFNERMHVEWENHVEHILQNGGELPLASVVAKAGFRSCAPCCRDMLALARPTGKTFIMVDLAEDDKRGTFHFVTGDKYLPVPKEALGPHEVATMKQIVSGAQDGLYESSEAIYNAVVESGVPVDEAAQAMYLSDRALMPAEHVGELKGNGLLEVLHAEHFARLSAEYGASIMRDAKRPAVEQEAVLACRERAKQMLIAAWQPHIRDQTYPLDSYADAAVAPLLPEEPAAYLSLQRAARTVRYTPKKLQVIDETADVAAPVPLSSCGPDAKKTKEDDSASVAGASTVTPDDGASDREGPDDGDF